MREWSGAQPLALTLIYEAGQDGPEQLSRYPLLEATRPTFPFWNSFHLALFSPLLGPFSEGWGLSFGLSWDWAEGSGEARDRNRGLSWFVEEGGTERK